MEELLNGQKDNAKETYKAKSGNIEIAPQCEWYFENFGLQSYWLKLLR